MNKPNDKPLSSEPPTGSGPDKITAETPTCPTKNIKCNYWTDDGCTADICWQTDGEQAGQS